FIVFFYCLADGTCTIQYFVDSVITLSHFCTSLEKIQEEIDTVLTPFQRIFYEDRKNMPYTNAVIHEIQRFKFVLLVGTFRLCAKDAAVLGFPIKKGTVIAPDIASALYDPEQWETPHQFNPNHFLDKDGKFFTRDAFIPFSIGKFNSEFATESGRKVNQCQQYWTLERDSKCWSQYLAVP
uniref:Uncharacterized protein n=1 Tax=Anolis carolinensis TaxID=28377 RepID=G1KUE5_ANOCA